MKKLSHWKTVIDRRAITDSEEIFERLGGRCQTQGRRLRARRPNSALQRLVSGVGERGRKLSPVDEFTTIPLTERRFIGQQVAVSEGFEMGSIPVIIGLVLCCYLVVRGLIPAFGGAPSTSAASQANLSRPATEADFLEGQGLAVSSPVLTPSPTPLPPTPLAIFPKHTERDYMQAGGLAVSIFSCGGLVWAIGLLWQRVDDFRLFVDATGRSGVKEFCRFSPRWY